jgi:hypothetical protein
MLLETVKEPQACVGKMAFTYPREEKNVIIPPKSLLSTQLRINPRPQKTTSAKCQQPCYTGYHGTVVRNACAHIQSGGPLLFRNQKGYALMRNRPSCTMGEHLFARKGKSKDKNESQFWGI